MSVQHGRHVGPSPGCGRPDKRGLMRQRVKFESTSRNRKHPWITAFGAMDTQTHSIAHAEEPPSKPADIYMSRIAQTLTHHPEICCVKLVDHYKGSKGAFAGIVRYLRQKQSKKVEKGRKSRV